MTGEAYRQQGNMGLFDYEDTMDKLNHMGTPLDKLTKVIDFELFRETLEDGLHRERMTNARAKPYDPVLMFKDVQSLIGFARNAAFNTLTNPVYNMNRHKEVVRLDTEEDSQHFNKHNITNNAHNKKIKNMRDNNEYSKINV